MPAHGPTDRQLAVLELLLEGRSRREIADALALSPASVPRLIAALLRLYDAPSERVLVARVLSARLARCTESLAAIEERRANRRSNA